MLINFEINFNKKLFSYSRSTNTTKKVNETHGLGRHQYSAKDPPRKSHLTPMDSVHSTVGLCYE